MLPKTRIILFQGPASSEIRPFSSVRAPHATPRPARTGRLALPPAHCARPIHRVFRAPAIPLMRGVSPPTREGVSASDAAKSVQPPRTQPVLPAKRKGAEALA
eukprot:2540738-Prymnesium_polylepis.1